MYRSSPTFGGAADTIFLGWASSAGDLTVPDTRDRERARECYLQDTHQACRFLDMSGARAHGKDGFQKHG